MAKSRTFSIYLLKNGFDPSNSLKEDHRLQLIEERNTNLPDGAIMYIADRPGNVPWWKDYWGITTNLLQIQKAGLVFLPVSDRWIILTFGIIHHQLIDTCFEYDFGLRTTLNALDPQKIKSTDILQPENARRQKIQLPIASTLTFFDIAHNESILKRLTGSVKEDYRELFKNITGADSVRISSNRSPNEISDLCATLIEIYEREDYLSSFPDIQNIAPVKDPSIIRLLDEQLLSEFNEKTINVVLAIPDIFDDSEDFSIRFRGEGRSSLVFENVYIGAYREYLEDTGNANAEGSIEKFLKHKMEIVDINGYVKKQYSIYKSFLFDCEMNEIVYHLCEGGWYVIKSNYIENLSQEINPYFIREYTALPPCDVRREDEYNSLVSDNLNVICLDKKNIAPREQSAVEPCDLILIDNDIIHLIHVKISTISASLSHLFNQGSNSVELLRMDTGAKEQLKTLLRNDNTFSRLIDEESFKIIFGIVTKKANSNLDNPSKNLPIFSRISLHRTIKSLKLMGIACSIFFIQDTYVR